MHAVLPHTALCEAEKLFFEERYMSVVSRYISKHMLISRVYTILRLLILVGSLLVPAALTLQHEDNSGSSGLSLYWMAFGLSVCVMVGNGINEAFGFAALNIRYWLSVRHLQSEGWCFLQLTGRYAEYEGHSAAFKHFSARIEKMEHHIVLNLVKGMQDQRRQEPQSTRWSASRGPSGTRALQLARRANGISATVRERKTDSPICDIELGNADSQIRDIELGNAGSLELGCSDVQDDTVQKFVHNLMGSSGSSSSPDAVMQKSHTSNTPHTEPLATLKAQMAKSELGKRPAAIQAEL
jgi:hypothetical protein